MAASFHVDRDVLIRAHRDTVWRYFTDSERFARWWGDGSRIDPRVGGEVHIRYPNGATASGQIKEMVAGRRVAFTFGYDDPAQPIPPGGSLVTIDLAERPDGTLVSLRHDVENAAIRDQHVPGWRYQLSVFSKVVCEEQHAQAAARIDRWFAAWNTEDEDERRAALQDCAVEDVEFADAFGVTTGRADLAQHIGMARMHMPLKLVRDGEVRQAQGTALVDWTAQSPDGAVMGRGSNVVDLSADGRIARVVGVPEV